MINYFEPSNHCTLCRVDLGFSPLIMDNLIWWVELFNENDRKWSKTPLVYISICPHTYTTN